MEVLVGGARLRLVTGDIAEQDTEAVVTAAHWRLNKGTGTDGTIHSKGGPAIFEECRRIGGCPMGDAVITTGGNLKARYVIHAVGPVWRGGDEHEAELLASAYRRGLEVAVENGVRSVSFPSISTGAFIYPMRLAAPIAMRTIVDFLRKGSHGLEEVRMVLYVREDEAAFRIYEEALREIIGGERIGGMWDFRTGGIIVEEARCGLEVWQGCFFWRRFLQVVQMRRCGLFRRKSAPGRGLFIARRRGRRGLRRRIRGRRERRGLTQDWGQHWSWELRQRSASKVEFRG